MSEYKSSGLWDYTKRLFMRWNGIYGLLVFTIFTIVSAVSALDVDVLVPDFVWFILLLISLYYGGYLVYTDVAPKLGKVVLNVSDAAFHEGGWSRHFPNRPGVELRVECANQGTGKVKLKKLDVIDLNLSTQLTQLFKEKEILFYEVPMKPGYPVHWPLVLDGGDFKDFLGRISVEVTVDNPKLFAESLRALRDFSVRLELVYEDIEGNERTERVASSGSYEEFKESAKGNWKSRGDHDLVHILEDIDT